jgi:uncharacterized protein (TIGR02147 family)
MIRKSVEALHDFSPAERQISSITVAISNQGLERLKAMIDGFRKELLAAANEDTDKERVMQINFQIFPLTKS